MEENVSMDERLTAALRRYQEKAARAAEAWRLRDAEMKLKEHQKHQAKTEWTITVKPALEVLISRMNKTLQAGKLELKAVGRSAVDPAIDRVDIQLVSENRPLGTLTVVVTAFGKIALRNPLSAAASTEFTVEEAPLSKFREALISFVETTV
jgi:hypothetical protein